jgi:molecular chaperone DnaJ
VRRPRVLALLKAIPKTVMPEKRCFYEVLGCSRESTPDEVRKAYKREALKHHPDRNGGDPKAEAVFKEVNEAYQVLSDDQKRRIYDQFGHAGFEGGAGFGGAGIGDVFSHMQDLFSEMFSGGFGQARAPRRGGDLRVQQRLSFKEAAFGCKREIVVQAPSTCAECSGSGARPGTKPEACPQCRGSGQVSNARGFVMFTTTCPRCRGQGAVIKAPCKACSGRGVVEKPKKVTVTFPAGIDGGQRLRVPGQGLAGPGGAPPGDLYVDIEVEDDPRFERDGVDIVTRVNVGFADAALGAQVRVPSIELDDSTLPLDIPQGTQPGSVFTMTGHGVPRLDGHGRGALIVMIQVDVPKQLSNRARELLGELDAELRGAVVSGTQSNEARRRAVAGK